LDMEADKPSNELQRIVALKKYHILDTAAEGAYDDITRLAAHICDVPISVVSLVDESRQWFKSKFGLKTSETPRYISFCAHAILHTEPLMVRDATKDKRFAENPLVTRSPFIRFYAGFPLISSDGHALGSLCAIDRKPRQLTRKQQQVMGSLARQVVELMELRRVSAHLAHALQHVINLNKLIPICARCKCVRDDDGHWNTLEAYFHSQADAEFTHSICPTCLEKERRTLKRVARNRTRRKIGATGFKS
jgi:GAF domain-containing protein